LSLADKSFEDVLSFYDKKIADNLKSENVYRDQAAVIKLFAEANNIPVKNDLPQITGEVLSKFDKSKLIIKDQWASHPTTKERVKRLEKSNFSSPADSDIRANSIFRNIKETQQVITNKLFSSISYQGEASFISFDDFRKEYISPIAADFFPQIYNGYYNDKNMTEVEVNADRSINLDIHDLFSDKKVDMVYSVSGLQNDLETLKAISEPSTSIKTFDYEGIRYKRKDANQLIGKLETELDELNKQINQNDADIYLFFNQLEEKQNRPKELPRLYTDFFAVKKESDSKFDLYLKLLNGLQFVRVTTPFAEISANLEKIKPLEDELKTEISQLITEYEFGDELTTEIRENFELYTSKTWEYFSGHVYEEQNLNILYAAMNNYASLLSRRIFLKKKRILTYQEELADNN
jgi:hypothetical protein